MPELSLAVRSVITGNKEVALGDYMGSAAVNTLLFGVFTLMNEGRVIVVSNFLVTFFFMLLGFGLFYLFTYKNNTISRKQGIILLGLYFVFISIELLRG